MVIKCCGRRMLLLVFLAASALWTDVNRAAAQGHDPSWSEPLQLSSPESQASRATLATDKHGRIHAFWSETYANQSPIMQYAIFDGQSWSFPIDIYVGTQLGNMLSTPTVVLDDKDTFHLVWADSWSGSAYYISSPLQWAISAQAWSEPLIIELPVYRPRMHNQADGTLHLVYSSYWGEPPSLAAGVYYVRLNAESGVWTQPLWLDPDIREQDAPALLEMAADDSDGLHVLWWYDNRDDSGAHDKSVRYAHSLDGGHTWSEATTVAVGTGEEDSTRVGGAVLAIVGRQVHLVWPQGRLPYRMHITSPDRGRTWGPARRILGDLEGGAGDTLIADSTGRLHFLGLLRFPDAVYHATWRGGSWSQPRLVYLVREGPFDSYEGRIHVHNLDAGIGAGNQLVITFTDPPPEERRGLYTMHRTLEDLEHLPVLPTPTPPERSEPSTSILTPTQAVPQPSSISQVSVIDPGLDAAASPPAGPGGAVALAVLSALALVATTSVVVLQRRRR